MGGGHIPELSLRMVGAIRHCNEGHFCKNKFFESRGQSVKISRCWAQCTFRWWSEDRQWQSNEFSGSSLNDSGDGIGYYGQLSEWPSQQQAQSGPYMICCSDLFEV